jgi:uncharacterized membrane protein YphA (DoxX/SURF4 family)
VFSSLTFWPWFAGLVILVLGLYSVRKEFSASHGLNKIIVLGRVFAAAPLAVFGGEHLSGFRFIAGGVPPWMPFHIFWAIFVGLALIAAAVSLALERYVLLSSALVAIMIFLFVVMLHIPRLMGTPHDRFAWTIVLRDSTFAAGFLAYAGAHTQRFRDRGKSPLVFVARIVMGVTFIFFAVMHVLYPQHVPGVPLERLMPSLVPAPHTLSAFTGLLLFLTGIAVLINKYARASAACLGLWIFLLTCIIYLPMLGPATGDNQIIESLNYIFDTLLFAGVILLLASAMPADKFVKTAAAPPAPKA